MKVVYKRKDGNICKKMKKEIKFCKINNNKNRIKKVLLMSFICFRNDFYWRFIWLRNNFGLLLVVVLFIKLRNGSNWRKCLELGKIIVGYSLKRV